MSSKIIFLGTGGARVVTARQLRATGGIVIKTKNKQIWIDPGPGALVRAKQFNISPEETDIILVSHNHMDHVNDMNAVLDAMTNGGYKLRGHLVTTKTVVEDYLSDHVKKSLTDITILDPEKNIKFGDITVIAKKAKHDTDAIGFKIITSDFSVGYTGDTGYFSGLAKQFEKTDVFIANVLYPFGKKLSKHLDAEIYCKLIEKVKPKLAIITGFGKTMLDADPMQQAREIQKRTKMEIVAAQDGMEINPVDYSANSNQKTLGNF